MKLHLASLGCARNLVDSETMLGHLIKKGWDITQEPAEADAIIVNTCSFISDAINESIDTILELAKFKKTGNCKKLLVAGCLPERFREKLAELLPEVDFFLGTGAYDQVAHVLENHPSGCKQICLLPNPEKAAFPETAIPRIRTSDTIAYVKIAEGCSKHCTYCIIPRLRGKKYRSKPAEDILHEARLLVQSGVKELNLVAQDTTDYGKDLFPSSSLAVLLTQLSEISNNIWIRFLYGHPESIDENVIKTIAGHSNICSYFDIPIQHASNRILKKMGRNYSIDDLRRLYHTIRSTIPDAALRTTIITGFPGETEKDFSILMDFIQEIRFDHLGVFTYSDSKDLPSHKLPLPVDWQTANQRQDLLMNQQAIISAANNQAHIDKTYPVLIERRESDTVFAGRTFFQAPEMDGITFVSSRNLKLGDFVQTRIKNAFEYDLSGEPV